MALPTQNHISPRRNPQRPVSRRLPETARIGESYRESPSPRSDRGLEDTRDGSRAESGLIKRMPEFAQEVIQDYLDTGKFKNHINTGTHSTTSENKDAVAHVRESLDRYIDSDNVPGVDFDSRKGHIVRGEGTTVVGQYEVAPDGTKERFLGIDGAVIYTRDTGEFVETISVSLHPEHSQGVQRFHADDPTKSFMSMDPNEF